jgi:hypothetical protein
VLVDAAERARVGVGGQDRDGEGGEHPGRSSRQRDAEEPRDEDGDRAEQRGNEHRGARDVVEGRPARRGPRGSGEERVEEGRPGDPCAVRPVEPRVVPGRVRLAGCQPLGVEHVVVRVGVGEEADLVSREDVGPRLEPHRDRDDDGDRGERGRLEPRGRGARIVARRPVRSQARRGAARSGRPAHAPSGGDGERHASALAKGDDGKAPPAGARAARKAQTMTHGIAIGQPFVYRGSEHAKLRGEHGIILEVLSPGLLLVAFDLPDGRQPVLKVPPEDVGVSAADAQRFLHPERRPAGATRSR